MDAPPFVTPFPTSQLSPFLRSYLNFKAQRARATGEWAALTWDDDDWGDSADDADDAEEPVGDAPGPPGDYVHLKHASPDDRAACVARVEAMIRQSPDRLMRDIYRQAAVETGWAEGSIRKWWQAACRERMLNPRCLPGRVAARAARAQAIRDYIRDHAGEYPHKTHAMQAAAKLYGVSIGYVYDVLAEEEDHP